MAQNNTNSPYSIRGYGELEDFNTAFCKSLGGASNGIRTEHYFSLSNPASLGGTKQVIFDFGFRGDYSKTYSSTASRTAYNGNFNYFSLAFPVYRKPIVKKDTLASLKSKKTKLYTEYHTIWSAAFGVTPFSSINSTYSKLTDTSYGQIGNYYSRSGGLNRVFLINNFNLNNNLSIGINSSFIFGQSRAYDGYFLFDSFVSRATINETNIRMNGFKFDLGIQKAFNDSLVKIDTSMVNGVKSVTKKKIPYQLVLGATFNNGAQLNYSTFHQILNKSNYYVTSPIDTVLLRENVKGKTALPIGYSAGFSFTWNNLWMLTGDYKVDRWGTMKKTLFTDSFTNSTQFNIGVAFRPDFNINSFRKRGGEKRGYYPTLEYRLGFRARNTGYNFLDDAGNINPLKEIGFSFGIGIPKIRSEYEGKVILLKSMFNITGEYIRRGSTANGMIAENLFRVTLGFTIPDVWFKKRKFD